MDIILEIILELAFEGTVEIAGSRKVPMCIRIPLMIFITAFFLFIIIGLFLVGIAIMKENVLMGLFMWGVVGLLIIGVARSVIKFKKSLV